MSVIRCDEVASRPGAADPYPKGDAMPTAVLNVRIADMEPFKRFIGKVTQAAERFDALAEHEIAELPIAVADGIAHLRSAVTEIRGNSEPKADA